MSYKSDSVKIWGLLGNRLHNLTLSIRNNNLAFMNLRHVFNMGTFIGIYKCVCICRGSVRAISPVWSTSRTRSVPEGSGVFAVVQSYQDEVVSVHCMYHQLPGAQHSTHTHTQAQRQTQANIVMSWPTTWAGPEGQGFRGCPIGSEKQEVSLVPVFKQMTPAQ